MAETARPRPSRTMKSSPDRVGRLARIFLLGATGREARLRAELAGALDAGVPLVQIKEAFLQLYLFAGFPRMINAFLSLAEVPGSSGGARRERTSPTRLRSRGLRNCRAIYGSQTLPMLARMEEMHPELPRWIVEEGYGKVLGRRWLSAKDRELISLPVLAWQGVKTQLYSHVRGALRLGNRPEEVSSIFAFCSGLIPASRHRLALGILRDLGAA